MKEIDIGEWLTDLVNDGEINDREDFLVTINGREIVILETKCDSGGDIDFKVKKSRC